jgi:hypothetical protein
MYLGYLQSPRELLQVHASMKDAVDVDKNSRNEHFYELASSDVTRFEKFCDALTISPHKSDKTTSTGMQNPRILELALPAAR